MQVLRMQLSNEEDLFFLHSLEVSEEDFQTLKVEQGILIDFGSRIMLSNPCQLTIT